MMGGHGRGEGGYVSIDGQPAPYSDYDYFVVVAKTDSAARTALTERLAEAAHRLENEVGVEVDFALLRAERLRAAEFSLMNAEMRWGHRVVAGDQNVLAAMRPMPFHRLPPGEITRLMLNRGSLLLMNQQRLQQGGLSAAEREVHCYPRECLISALPLLLSESRSLLEPCVANTLAIPASTSWREAVQVFLRQWKRYA